MHIGIADCGCDCAWSCYRLFLRLCFRVEVALCSLFVVFRCVCVFVFWGLLGVCVFAFMPRVCVYVIMCLAVLYVCVLVILCLCDTLGGSFCAFELLLVL